MNTDKRVDSDEELIIGDNIIDDSEISNEENLGEYFGDKFIKSYVFLFANPKSGGNMAKKWIDNKMLKVTFLNKSVLYVTDIFDTNRKNILYHKIKRIIEKRRKLIEYQNIAGNILNKIEIQNGEENKIEINSTKEILACDSPLPKIICAGGDGTIIGICEDLITLDIDPTKIQFCILPFGTGNDTARVTGWGGSPGYLLKGKDILARFEILMKLVLNSKQKFINIWESALLCHEDGALLKIRNNEAGKRQKIKIGNSIERKFINCFSLGVDARIGFGFDKLRSKSQFCNLCVYCWEGIKKTVWTKTSGLNSIIEKINKKGNSEVSMCNIEENEEFKEFHGREETKDNLESKEGINHNEIIPDQEMNDSRVFNQEGEITLLASGKELLAKQNKEMMISKPGESRGIFAEKYWKGNPQSIVFLNIQSFMGGRPIWTNSKNKFAFMTPKKGGKKHPDPFLEQDFGDQLLEILNFPSVTDVSKESMYGGNAKRLAQLPGPFRILFKRKQAYNSFHIFIRNMQRARLIECLLNGKHFRVYQEMMVENYI